MASNTAPPAQAVIVRDGNAEQLELPAATFGRSRLQPRQAFGSGCGAAGGTGQPAQRCPRPGSAAPR